MITPILERMLLTGRATKQNYVHGLSGAGFIECPQNRWLVITDIWFSNFQDQTFLEPDEIFKQLNLRSQNGQQMQNYVFKNNCFLDASDNDNLVDGDTIHLDVFDIFKDHVIITISKSVSYNAGAVDFIALDPQSNQLFPPNGYGISTPVVKRAVDGAGTEVVPGGVKNFNGLVPTARASTAYRIDTVLNVTTLVEPVSNQQLPLVNFTVITINSTDIQNN